MFMALKSFVPGTCTSPAWTCFLASQIHTNPLPMALLIILCTMDKAMTRPHGTVGGEHVHGLHASDAVAVEVDWSSSTCGCGSMLQLQNDVCCCQLLWTKHACHWLSFGIIILALRWMNSRMYRLIPNPAEHWTWHWVIAFTLGSSLAPCSGICGCALVLCSLLPTGQLLCLVNMITLNLIVWSYGHLQRLIQLDG